MVSRPQSVRRRVSITKRFTELVRYRELVVNLVKRELKARYKNSALGFFWSLLNPLCMMLVFTFVFTVMMPNSKITNFPIFFLCGFLPWQYFSSGVMTSMGSIVYNSNLVKKVYFPREALPIGTVLAALVKFLVGPGCSFRRDPGYPDAPQSVFVAVTVRHLHSDLFRFGHGADPQHPERVLP